MHPLGALPCNTVIQEIPSRDYLLFRHSIKPHECVFQINRPGGGKTHRHSGTYALQQILFKFTFACLKLIVLILESSQRWAPFGDGAYSVLIILNEQIK